MLPPVRWKFVFKCAVSRGKRNPGNQPNEAQPHPLLVRQPIVRLKSSNSVEFWSPPPATRTHPQQAWASKTKQLGATPKIVRRSNGQMNNYQSCRCLTNASSRCGSDSARPAAICCGVPHPSTALRDASPWLPVPDDYAAMPLGAGDAALPHKRPVSLSTALPSFAHTKGLAL